jgi:hypothetical protein
VRKGLGKQAERNHGGFRKAGSPQEHRGKVIAVDASIRIIPTSRVRTNARSDYGFSAIRDCSVGKTASIFAAQK